MQRRFWTTVVASALGVGLTFTLFVATTHLSRAQEQPPQNTEQLSSPLGTAFTYQGQLKKNGVPIAASCLMAFRLYDQATTGNLIGSPITMTVPITNGLFTVQLDFGANVFAGEARWLGIQVQCPADAAYVDLGRQALTAAPYALYSTSTGALQGRSIAGTAPGSGQVLKWNGSAWSPADDAIGSPGSGDISAVVAGTGLSGGGTTGEVTLTVAFAGSGISTTVARSDHTHSGVYSLVGHTHPGGDITSPVANAVNADLLDGQHASAFAGATHDHLGQTWTGSDNPLVITGSFGAPDYASLVLGNSHSAGAGLRVESPGRDGDGVVVNSGEHGVVVNSGKDGVVVVSAGLDGMTVNLAGEHGVHVNQAGGDGVHVYKTGNPSVRYTSSYSNGFEVAGAEGYGLYVGRADMDGVQVGSAGSAGVRVNSATTGLRVDSASDVGVHIFSADRSGVLVQSANRYGVFVASAGEDGIYAHSTSASFYGGRFVNSATGGAGLYAQGANNTAPDLVLGGNSATSDDGRIRSDPAYSSSDVFVLSNDAVQVDLDNDNDESGNFWILNGADTTVFAVNESGDMTAIGTKSALITTQDYGQRKLYALESPQNWFEDFGTAQLVNGQATVPIEPIFAQTVNLTEAYHVFLTPLGDCALYVAAKTPASFTVKAMSGQTCSIAFDYRIVAKRLGYEALRLDAAPSTEPGGEE
jgi:hypothetical protein